jgi:hypothetical protein
VVVCSSHSAFATAAISLHAPHLVLFASRSYPSCAPSRASRSWLSQSHPSCAHPRRSLLHHRAHCPPLLMLVVTSRASGQSPAKPRALMSMARAGGARTPRPKSTSPDLPSHMLQVYVSSVFRYFRCMLQVFRMVAAKVYRDVAYVASVSESCCKRLFKIFHLFQTYVASIFIWMLHMFHNYVARVCSKCFRCFNLMLQ